MLPVRGSYGHRACSRPGVNGWMCGSQDEPVSALYVCGAKNAKIWPSMQSRRANKTFEMPKVEMPKRLCANRGGNGRWVVVLLLLLLLLLRAQQTEPPRPRARPRRGMAWRPAGRTTDAAAVLFLLSIHGPGKRLGGGLDFFIVKSGDAMLSHGSLLAFSLPLFSNLYLAATVALPVVVMFVQGVA
ncbi:hypothetical protein IWX91DRAFT_134261 [Phyllosticta citricarpa]